MREGSYFANGSGVNYGYDGNGEMQMREGSYFANGSGVNYGYNGNGEMQIGQVDGDAEMAELQMPTIDRVNESLVQRAVENPMLMKRVVWMGGFETQELVA
jgi:hypothetical protein